MTQHSDVHRQRGYGMKCEMPSCRLEREGKGQEPATCYSSINRQEEDGVTGNGQMNWQEKDGADPTRTEHPDALLQKSDVPTFTNVRQTHVAAAPYRDLALLRLSQERVILRHEEQGWGPDAGYDPLGREVVIVLVHVVKPVKKKHRPSY